MSHGHDHGAGHGDAHGHGAEAAHDAAHGPAEIPPEPAVRSITPAPEDFRNLPGEKELVWPVLWMALAALLVGTLLRGGWPEVHDGHGAAAHGVETHK